MSLFPSLPEDAGVPDIQGGRPDLYEHWNAFRIALMRGPSPLSEAERELIGAFSSGLNACSYCYQGHRISAESFGVDVALFEKLMDEIDTAPVDEKLKPILHYVRKLTLTPSRMVQADADAVYGAGWDEHALHDAVAVCATFAFMNRLVLGHGVKYSEARGVHWREQFGVGPAKPPAKT